MSAFDDYLNAAPAAPAQSFNSYVGAAPAVAAASSPAAPSAMAPAPVNGSQPGGLASFGAGLGRGVQQMALGAQQLLGHGLESIGSDHVGPWLVNDAEQGLARGASDYAPYSAAHPIAAGAGQVAGQIAAGAPLAAALPEAAAATLGGRLLGGAALGAAQGAMTPVEGLQPGQSFGGQKLQQIGIGAGLGAAAAPVAGIVGDALQGAGGAAQQQLAKAGVTMTPGQIMGGTWGSLENKLTSVPILGDVIKGAQQRAVQDFNRATYDQVLAPLGQKYSGPVGQQGVSAVRQTIGDAYDNALSRMTFQATDPQFQADIGRLAGMAQGLPPAQQQAFMNILQTQVFGKLGPQGMMDGQTLKGAQSELGRIARGYGGDPSYDNRQLGAAIGEIKNAIDNSLPRYNAPDAVQGLANANAAYANFARLRAASASQGAMNNGGVFSPAQLQSAVRAADKTVGKGSTATGNALMQDWSQTGMGVLGKGYPDSGTAGRLGTAGAIGALISHPALLANPGTWAAAAPMAAYTPYGQKLAQALLMSRPAGAQALGSAVNRFLPSVSALGVPALANGAQR
ncbi:hypothetical protein [Burkholderia gladioli]|uniref:hypothetical protein n=1 Tax=Burkholderia gladioli TaxID=28095 RepID=UPI000F525185|nr:hypothetical protein [Burkholderia gladioli]